MKKLWVLLILILAAVNTYAQGNVFTLPGPNIPGLITNGSNLTTTVPFLAPDGTAAVPSYAFSAQPNTGFYRQFTNEFGISNGGTLKVLFAATQMRLYPSHLFGWANPSASDALDVILARDAANTLALRNSTNPQTFNIYNTYTDASNYERLALYWNASAARITTLAAGTGTVRILQLQSFWNFDSGNGRLYPTSDDATAFGAIANQWTHGYFSRSIQGSKNKTLTDAGAAVSIVRIAVPTNGFAAGKIIYTATSTDGTDILVTSGSCNFAAADTGGTVTAGTPQCDTPATAYRRANTLVCTWSGAVSTTNYDIQVTCTDNKAGTQTMSINYRLDMPQPNTVTPQ